ncbi:sigma-70 family RNA polymerase sigma factor [Runella sp. CRIBMP]|uniref:RNA polymerase sigma factor n=1 Tax=Runella sp. CRIBMP TaxID=2683261 RepID=UPI0014131E2D|nr:RNA polymerase sigma factor [Runella sp. CRIBMP]NBB17796.1 sigma-70 family RNA polymerase sigma factor [Runella sp. CRIBMP]
MKTAASDFKEFDTNDPQVFGKIYDVFYPKIFGYAFRRVGDYDIARDVAAETFLKAFLNVKKYRFEGHSISAWLYKIATNEINLFFRSQKYRPDLFGQISEEMLSDRELMAVFEKERMDTERQMEEYEAFTEVQKHLKTLPVKYQEVIALKYFEEKTLLEISAILDKPEGTVKSLLSRGLEQLRQKFE